jgi:MFS family permease
MDTQTASGHPWYHAVTGYQWLVLLICSLGWIFDAFEGQLFVATMNEAMPALLPQGTKQATIDVYNNIALGMFLVGGALGGVLFGVLSDRIGRTRTMILSILCYSCFTGITALAQTWWQMALLRFLVALGVAGGWAVGTAMVAEVFPTQARAWSLAIFSASSVFGVYLAVLVGAAIVAYPSLGWRWAFASGVLPALLALWVYQALHEPEQWLRVRDAARKSGAQQLGKFTELFAPGLRRRSLVGLALAFIGLGTYWGVHIYGRELYRRNAERQYLAALDQPPTAQAKAAVLKAHGPAIKRAEMLGMFLNGSGAGLGLLAFGAISERLGRRGAFLFYCLGALTASLILFQVLAGSPNYLLWFALPVFGFLTVGMNAGASVYFPELFPTRLRATGTGFCYNGGRLLAASVLVLSALLREQVGLGMEDCVSILSFLFLLGALVLVFAPETKGRDLPA